MATDVPLLDVHSGEDEFSFDLQARINALTDSQYFRYMAELTGTVAGVIMAW